MRLTCMIMATIALTAVVSGCITHSAKKSAVEEVLAWRAERETIMRSPDSLLALVGLFELEFGILSFGAAENNHLRVEAASGNSFPDLIGRFQHDGATTIFQPEDDVEVLNEGGVPITGPVEMIHDGDAPTKLRHGSLTWTVIRRGVDAPVRPDFMPTALNDALGAKFYVRVWDAKSAALESLESPEFYPIDPAWRFEGEYRAYDQPTVFYQKNVQGLIEETPTTGVIVFTKDGVEYELETADEGDNLFIVFADETNGDETWGGGRFMDIPKPENGAGVIVDFNQTRNPWCAYSAFSTCPLPTKQNTFPFAVRAGALKPTTSGK